VSDVFQEVDEELRRQQIDKALKLYGPWVTALVVVILLGFGGYNFWQSYQDRRATAASDQLIHGMEALAGGDREGAEATFAALADNAPGGYPMLAQFQEAAAKRQAGDREGALALYDAIAADADAGHEYRDLARFYAGLTALSIADITYDDIQTRLQPVADGTGPWRFHAREVLGYAAYRDAHYETAETLYRQLTDDALTPTGVAARATEMLNLTEAAIDAQGDSTAEPSPQPDDAAPTE